jgi:hypothetical protein
MDGVAISVRGRWASNSKGALGPFVVGTRTQSEETLDFCRVRSTSEVRSGDGMLR